VLATGFFRIRQVIRDQIYAQDVARLIRSAGTLPEIAKVLEENASTFGFLHIEVCREDAPRPGPLVVLNGHAARAWRLDYPVTPHDFTDGLDYMLRIWSNPQASSQPYGAERVAKILAPVIEEWMVTVGPKRAIAQRGTAAPEAATEVTAELAQRKLLLQRD
jgi:hypothetical protein